MKTYKKIKRLYYCKFPPTLEVGQKIFYGNVGELISMNKELNTGQMLCYNHAGAYIEIIHDLDDVEILGKDIGTRELVNLLSDRKKNREDALNITLDLSKSLKDQDELILKNVLEIIKQVL